jgi:alpha-D-xyloside xylohydrolase
MHWWYSNDNAPSQYGGRVRFVRKEGEESMCNGFFHKILFTCLTSAILFASHTDALVVNSWVKQTDGVLFTLDVGKLKIEVATDEILRHVYSLDSIPSPAGNIIIKTGWGSPSFQATEDASTVTITTAKVKAVITKSNASVRFTDLNNVAILAENTSGKSLTSVSGHYEGRFGFSLPANEGIYGFGQPGKNVVWGIGDPSLIGNLDLRNESFPFYQANRTAVTPMFTSSAGYGVLLNCYSRMQVNAGISFVQDWATKNVIDYYFIHGPLMDSIVARYRWLTGPVPLLPKAAYGFINSYCQYNTQAEVLSASTQYRTNKIPVDYIVLDWYWWTCCGSMAFNTANFPNAQKMIDSIHGQKSSFMIAVWPQFALNCNPNYKTMNDSGWLLPISGYQGASYNVLIPAASKAFWNMMKPALIDKGADALWFDVTDPEPMNQEIWSQEFYNIYSLQQCGAIYTSQRSSVTDKRVFVLTRSSYAGQQRSSSVLWSGDIASSYSVLNNQVPGGLNICAAGLPYWTTDIGGYWGGASDDLFVRWFQYGVFCPLFRVHGKDHREIYLLTGATRTICEAYDNLRYRLMPYIYSLAAMVTNNNYTMMRMLPFDFPSDPKVRNCNDQFMFGPALLVNPVLQANVTSRSVYLPSGTWIDFWTGTSTAGGTTITASAPQDRIPLYARAGAILPMGPEIQYATQRADTIELRAYPGANGSFTIYEDEADNYNYETGKYATIPITYTDNPQNVIIGARSGSFTGMDQKKVFNIVYVKSNHGTGEAKTATPDCQLVYTGAQVSCSPVVGTFGPVDAAGISHLLRPGMTIKTISNHVVLDRSFADISKSVAVYDLTGKLVGMKVVQTNAIDLRKDLGVPNGVYIVKVKEVR